MTIENMNCLKFNPHKDYTANRLVSGVLQLASNTSLVIDETLLEQGQLDTRGWYLGFIHPFIIPMQSSLALTEILRRNQIAAFRKDNVSCSGCTVIILQSYLSVDPFLSSHLCQFNWTVCLAGSSL